MAPSVAELPAGGQICGHALARARDLWLRKVVECGRRPRHARRSQVGPVGRSGYSVEMGALVLVVDDSAGIRSQIRGVLQQLEGFDDFIEAGDGLQAFKLMVDRRPDLV